MGNGINEYLQIYAKFEDLDNRDTFENYSEIYDLDNEKFYNFKKNAKKIHDIVAEIEQYQSNPGFESTEYSHLIFTFLTYLWVHWEYLYVDELKYIKRFCMNYILHSYKNIFIAHNESELSSHNISMVKNIVQKIMESEGLLIEFITDSYKFIDSYEFEEQGSIIIISF
jgi:hypothetical protein